jgi:hypothetical protein
MSYVNENPAFYVNKPTDPKLVYNYGWYAVITIGELLVIDRREDKFGEVYTTAEQLTEQGGITTDRQLYELLADGMVAQIKSPFFAVWEIGQEKPMPQRYFSIQYACKKAHALAVSEPTQLTKENKNERIYN